MSGGRIAVLRADASTSIGTGHVVRSCVLGRALVDAGWSVSLATRVIPDDLASDAEQSRVGIVRLPAADDPGAERDVISSVVAGRVALVVGDHYGLDATWFRTMAELAGRPLLVAIDDLADRELPVDVLVNQNLGASPASYGTLLPPTTRRLLGPRYALVASEFAARRAVAARRDGSVRRLLVFISGADQPDATRLACTGLTAEDLDVDVVVGAAYPHLAPLRSLLAGRPRYELHVNTARMADLMARADLAIGAPSSASWERCTLGLPTVLIVVADNQRDVAKALVDAGAARSLGWYDQVSPAQVASAVRALLDDTAAVAAMARHAADVTDGRGAARVVAEIEAAISGRAGS